MLIAQKIAFLRSRSLNFAIAIIPRSFDQMVIAKKRLRSRSTIKRSPITHALCTVHINRETITILLTIAHDATDVALGAS